MKRFKGITLLLIILIVISGFTTKRDPNELTIYTSIETDLLETYLADFKSKYPDIKLNVVRESTGVITSKLLAEKDNPQADVIWNVAASSLLIMDNMNLLEPYKPKELDKIDEKFYDTKNEIPTWVGTSLWSGAITVNTEEMKSKGLPIPKSYKDLTNPIYKGEIVMPDPTSSGTGFLMISSWIQNSKGENKWEIMDGIDKNIKMYTSSGSAPTKSTAIGEQAIGLGMDFESLNLEKTVPQIETIFPEDGLPWELEAISILKKDKIKDDAKIFYDWALSDDAMNLYAKDRTLITKKDAVSKLEGLPKDVKTRLSENDLNWAADNKRKINLEWTKKYTK